MARKKTQTPRRRLDAAAFVPSFMPSHDDPQQPHDVHHSSDDESDDSDLLPSSVPVHSSHPSRSSPTLMFPSLYRLLARPCGTGTCDGPTIMTQLRPQLRPYQSRAVAWMQARERGDVQRAAAISPNEASKAVTSTANDNGVCRGGVLADEMGLGKTVELLALILGDNQTPQSLPPPSPPQQTTAKRRREQEQEREQPETSVAQTKRKKRAEVEQPDGVYWEPTLGRRGTTFHYALCACGHAASKESKDDVACSTCGNFFHRRCFDLPSRKSAPQLNFTCGRCVTKRVDGEATSLANVPSRATLIVVPSSIRSQWLDEMQRHVHKLMVLTTDSPAGAAATLDQSDDPPCIVLNYEGQDQSGRYPTTPQMLHASFDIVITTYEVLKKDMRYVNATGENSRARHSMRASHIVPTPLTSILWKRVVLDEAQLVEGGTAEAAKLCRALLAQRRWCTTGTPFHKGIGDAAGLLALLRISPCDSGAGESWYRRHVAGPIEACDADAARKALDAAIAAPSEAAAASPTIQQQACRYLISSIAPILWRTRRRDAAAANELPFPRRRESTTTLQFTAVESEWYKDIQARSIASIAAACKTARSRGEGTDLTVRERRKIFPVLLSLRQACDHFAIGSRGLRKTTRTRAGATDAFAGAQVYATSDDAMANLLLRRRLEAEDALRAVLHGSFGLAAICAMLGDHGRSVLWYRYALSRSDAELTIHEVRTDALQRMHLCHNLRRSLDAAIASGSMAEAATVRLTAIAFAGVTPFDPPAVLDAHETRLLQERANPQPSSATEPAGAGGGGPSSCTASDVNVLLSSVRQLDADVAAKNNPAIAQSTTTSASSLNTAALDTEITLRGSEYVSEWISKLGTAASDFLHAVKASQKAADELEAAASAAMSPGSRAPRTGLDASLFNDGGKVVGASNAPSTNASAPLHVSALVACLGELWWSVHLDERCASEAGTDGHGVVTLLLNQVKRQHNDAVNAEKNKWFGQRSVDGMEMVAKNRTGLKSWILNQLELIFKASHSWRRAMQRLSRDVMPTPIELEGQCGVLPDEAPRASGSVARQPTRAAIRAAGACSLCSQTGTLGQASNLRTCPCCQVDLEVLFIAQGRMFDLKLLRGEAATVEELVEVRRKQILGGRRVDGADGGASNAGAILRVLHQHKELANVIQMLRVLMPGVTHSLRPVALAHMNYLRCLAKEMEQADTLVKSQIAALHSYDEVDSCTSRVLLSKALREQVVESACTNVAVRQSLGVAAASAAAGMSTPEDVFCVQEDEAELARREMGYTTTKSGALVLRTWPDVAELFAESSANVTTGLVDLRNAGRKIRHLREIQREALRQQKAREASAPRILGGAAHPAGTTARDAAAAAAEARAAAASAAAPAAAAADGTACPVCGDPITVFLDCGHAVCGQCAKKLARSFATRIAPAASPGSPSGRNGVAAVKCPICREPTARANAIRVAPATETLADAEGVDAGDHAKVSLPSTAAADVAAPAPASPRPAVRRKLAMGEEDAPSVEEEGSCEKHLAVEGNYGTKLEAVVRRIMWISRQPQVFRSDDQQQQQQQQQQLAGGAGGSAETTAMTPKQRCVIFSDFADTLKILSQCLTRNGVAHCLAVSRGDVPLQVRTFEKADELAADCPAALLMPLKHGGMGLNVLSAQHVVFVEPCLHRGQEEQAKGRVARVGQRSAEVVTHHFKVEGTVEESLYGSRGAGAGAGDDDDDDDGSGGENREQPNDDGVVLATLMKEVAKWEASR